MKRESKPVPLRKALSIVLTGFACGFCLITAVLTYSDHPLITVRIVALGFGAVLALVAAFLLNRFL